MELKYTNESITSPNGIDCFVLDTKSIDFSSAPLGQKTKDTLVIRAKAGEMIDTINSDGNVESTYITEEGDAVFYNNEKDRYVPVCDDGRRLKFNEIEGHNYRVTGFPSFMEIHDATKRPYGVFVVNTDKYRVLPEIIVLPTCLKDAFGPGQHQFLFEGATLKQDPQTGLVTGIEKKAFDETWEVLEEKKESKK